MPPLVRRAPLIERIKAHLNPYDWALSLAEELNSQDWDEFSKDWSLYIGATANFVFMVARANSQKFLSMDEDDIFEESSNVLAWFCTLIVWILLALSILNSWYTFYRKRRYRLFETSLDAPPSTPSAHRVRVESSPSSSPLRFLSDLINMNSAESRAHPDSARDVWEIAVWDPIPICLRLTCLFSPLHAFIYWMKLPTATLDPRPSVTVATAILFTSCLSLLLSLLQSSFVQQSKDAAIIHKEVLHEYDTKFVHPSLNRPVRDVSTQTLPPNTKLSEVNTYTPVTIVNRGFRMNPNPAYASQYDPQRLINPDETQRLSRPPSMPSLRTPMNGPVFSPPATSTGRISPTRHARPMSAMRQPQFRPPSRAGDAPTGDGGSLGVYTHANSPLRKAASTNFLRDGKERREGSPVKRMSASGSIDQSVGTASGLDQRFASLRGDGRRQSGRF